MIAFLKQALAADTSRVLLSLKSIVCPHLLTCYRSIDIGPAAANLYMGLIDSPGAASGPGKAIPAFDEPRAHRCAQRRLVV